MVTPGADRARPLLLELDQGHWDETLQRVEPWLVSTMTLQSTFRRLADDVTGRVSEPHIKEYLGDVATTARRHETAAGRLHAAFGLQPKPAAPTELAAGVVSAGRQLAAQVVGRLAGARGGGWRGMRELLRSNLDAISGFAVCEQLGLALARPQVVDLVFPVIQEKATHQLLLQELLLETASTSLLYHQDA